MRFKRTFLLVIILTLIINILGGCGEKESSPESGEYRLYYVNNDATKLVTVTYDVEKKDAEDIVGELIANMNVKRSGYIAALPTGIKIKYYKVSGDTVTINYDSNYYKMDSISEIFVRAAIVLTLTQIEKIEYVDINIEGQPLFNSEGNIVGKMSSSDFVDKVGKTINNYDEITTNLYFSNRIGNRLIKEEYKGLYDSSEPLEKFIVQKLIDGPTGNKSYRSIPKDVKLLGISTKDGICYVNFDSSIETKISTVKDDVLIYSIVNSLLEVSYINKVQITVNGESDMKLHNNISIKNPFTKNQDIVEAK